MSEPRTWEDYTASSVKDFLKHYTDGDYGHGGSRYECAICGAEYNDHFGVKRCFYFSFHEPEYDASEHAIEIEFDENGVEITNGN